MKFILLNESENNHFGYHYGDLNVAKKADPRKIMGGRGTGHFGTGFYMVGTFNPDKAYDYAKRQCWKIDLSKYNLYKPKSNSDAYKLHDSLKEINYADENFIKYLIIDADKIADKCINDYIYEIEYLLSEDEDSNDESDSIDFDDLDIDDIDLDNDDIDKILKDISKKSIKESVSNNESKIKELISKLRRTLADSGVSEYDIDYIIEYIENKNFINIESKIRRVLSDVESQGERFKNAVKYLTATFGSSAKDKIISAICSPDQEDSKSTVFMKSLGFEGIDVTHLNADAEGLQGLDNFGYGSVIYDLKPNTYEKIKGEKQK